MITSLSRHLFESTLFCALLGALACCFRRQGAAARYVLWLIGISKFAIPTAPLIAVGAHIAFLLPATSSISSLAVQFSAVLAAFSRIVPSGMGASSSTAIFIVWGMGTTFMFVSWLLRLRESYGPLTAPNEKEYEALELAKRRLEVRMPIRLCCSNGAKEPSTLGLLRPTITIPQGLCKQLTSAEFGAVLTHEVAHARRYDNLAGVFVHCLRCLFWFHPLLWIAERCLIAERERACDELVIRCGTTPQTYLAGIVKVCKFHTLGSVAGVSAMSGSDLKTRLESIRSYQLPKPVPYLSRLLLAAAGILITILPIAGGYCEQCVSNGGSSTPPRKEKLIKERSYEEIHHHVSINRIDAGEYSPKPIDSSQVA